MIFKETNTYPTAIGMLAIMLLSLLPSLAFSQGGCATCNGLPPVNDACSGAIDLGILTLPTACDAFGGGGIGTPQNITGSNVCATAEFPYISLISCQTGGDMASPAADVWYRFQTTGTVLDVQIASALNGVSMGLWVDDGQGCGNLLARGCAETSFSGNLAANYSSLNPGIYYLQISGSDTLDRCDFTLTLTNSTDCASCILQNNLTVSPTPIAGRYQAGTTVAFTYVISNYNQTSINWIHGISPVFGTGWDLNTLTGQIAPTACASGGSWSWYNTPITGVGSGITSVGPGFFYESISGCPTIVCDPNNPGDNYGDSGASDTCALIFQWTISTLASCAPGQNGADLSVEMFNYSDAETGSWSPVACELDPNFKFLATLFCCDTMLLSTRDASCYGLANGSCTVQGQGTAPWDYELRDAQGNVIGSQANNPANYTFNNLLAGNYTMIVADATTFCTDTKQFRIGQPDSIAASYSVTDETCAGECDGTASVNASGGTPPYTYLWSDNQTSQTASGLCTGFYDVTITDDSSCNLVLINIEVLGPPALTIQFITSTDATCVNVCNGSAAVVHNGGIPPFTYVWAHGDLTQSIDELCVGTYFVTVTDSNGCSVSGMKSIGSPAPIPPTNLQIEICAGDSVFAGGDYQTEAGVYNDTLLTGRGCDSVLVTELAVIASVSSALQLEICDGDSAFAGGAYQTQPGVYYDTLVAMSGCDSILETTLEFSDAFIDSTNIEICQGDTVFVGGGNQTESGFYYDTLRAVSGCDSILVSELIVNPNVLFSQQVDICEGDSVFAGGAYQTQSGVYTDSLIAILGCDSIIETTVTVLPVFVDFALANICQGDSIFIGGRYQTESGTYNDVLTSINGCDSIVVTELIVHPNTISNLQVEICDGESFFVGGGNQTESGTYYDTLVATNGCDSIVQTALIVNQNPELSFATDIVCFGELTQLTNSSTGIDADAIYYIDYFNDGSIDVTIPAALFPGDTSLFVPVVGVSEIKIIAANSTGCTDTLIISVVVNDLPVLSFATDIVCFGELTQLTNSSTGVDADAIYFIDYFNDGSVDATISAALFPADTALFVPIAGASEIKVVVVNGTGCSDSLIIQVMVKELPEAVNLQSEICDGDSLLVGGDYQTLPGFYNDTLIAANGCDSIVITELIVLPIAETSLSMEVCDGDSAFLAGNWQTQSGDYIDIFTAINGCDSVLTTTLTVFDPINPNFSVQNVSCGCSSNSTGSSDDLICTLNFGGLQHGTIIDSSFSMFGVSVSGIANGSNPNRLIVFNSDLSGTADSDLEANIGNLIIFPTTLTDNNGDGLVDNPNDQGQGGVITFAFDEVKTVYSIDIIDNERNGGTITAYDEFNNMITSINVPTAYNGAVQTIAINAIDVKKLEVEYADSRAVGRLRIACPANACSYSFDGLTHGEIVSNQLVSQGITISGTSKNGNVYPNEVIIFNSDLTGTADDDLEVGVGNLIILPEQIIDLDGDGFVDDPDDSPVGGTLILEFDRDRMIYSFDLIDNDRNGGTATAYDGMGNIVVVVNTPSIGTGTIQTVTMNAPGVRRLEIEYVDSRGLSNLIFDCEEECCDGSVTAMPTGGGSSPYQYNWSTGATTATIDSLCEGIYYVTITSQFGCMTTDSVNVGKDDANIINEQAQICQGDSILLGGKWQTEAGIYTDTLGSSGNCLDIVVTELTVLPGSASSLQTTICQGDSLFVGGDWQTDAGTYDDIFIANNGCDSIVSTELTVLEPVSDSTQISICQGDSLFVGGKWQTTSGVYSDIYEAVNGCDSILSTELTVLEVVSDSTQALICQGDSLFVGGEWQTKSGVYSDTTVSAIGCDSVVITTLSVLESLVVNEQAMICEGDSIFLEGDWQTEAGSYKDTLASSGGCDSIVVTTLSVFESSIVNDQATICEGDSIFLGKEWQTEAGLYNDTLLSSRGCDSVLITSLIVLPAPVINTQASICDGDSILLGRDYQTESGFYADTLQTVDGCDSVIVTELIVLPVSSSLRDLQICQGDSAFAGGAWQHVSGIYVDVFIATNSCDSIVTTDLMVLNTLVENIQREICEGDSLFVGGDWQTQTGIYSDTLVSVSGCDSILITELRVSPTMNLSTQADSVNCTGGSDGEIILTVTGGTPNYTYNWSNGMMTKDITGLIAGSFSVTVADAAGCAATTTTNVNQPQPLALGATTSPVSCFGGSDGSIDLLTLGGTPPYKYLWSTGDTTQDVSGLPADQYTVMVTDNKGCLASVIIIVKESLEIQLSAFITSESAPNANDGIIDLSVNEGRSPYEYLWSTGDTTEDISGLGQGSYEVTVTDDNGCVAIDTFLINVLPLRLALGLEDNKGEQNFLVDIYPNPFKHDLVVSFSSAKSDEAYIVLRDLMGRRVYIEQLDVTAGENNYKMNLSADVVSGLYFIDIHLTGQNLRSVKSIVKD